MRTPGVDPRLKLVLQDFARSYAFKREAALRGYDFEALRTSLAEARDRALERREELLDDFEEKARAHGSTVIRARDAAEANRAILETCRLYGVTRLVKTKSMVSEEIRLNAFLAGHGIEARETDLGEWIVQLSGRRPTHMVMPAIHLTRNDVRRIFADRLGRDVPEDIPGLVRLAREEMRKEIFAAQAGLSGANALIAENGSILLVTNEGNGRLVTSVPPVHIVLASVEKVLPTIEDALALLRLLPRNATGQAITSYASFIAGPHGRAQVIVLLDNHRSEMAADPVFKTALRCVKCSACLNVCPVYQAVGGEAWSHVYMGGIGALLTAWIHGLEKARDLAALCLRCHRCEAVCATKIPIGDLVASLAARINAERGAPAWKRLVFEGVIGRPALQAAAFGAARAARSAAAGKGGFARKLPAPLRRFDRFRALPAPAAVPLSKLFAGEFGAGTKAGPPGPAAEDPAKAPKGAATIFAGCLVEHVYPGIGLAAARVLARLGYGVRLAPARCCGFPASNAGFPAAARRAFEGLLPGLGKDEPVITLCPTCATMLSKAGPALSKRPGAAGLAARVFPFGRFLMEKDEDALAFLIEERARPAVRAAAVKATYHDSCHHKFILGAGQASRSLVEMSLGTKIEEMAAADACCGFAGSYAVEHPGISEALLFDKLAAVAASGAGLVALDCPGCLLQIRGGCRRAKMPVRVAHTAELVAEALFK